MRRQIQCYKCGGSGCVDLPESLSETLSLVPLKRAITAQQIAEVINGVGVCAQNNRLEMLRKLGFVIRKREGKFWRYSRK